MSLTELSVRQEVPKMTDEQLLDIKKNGYNAVEYHSLVERSGAKHYREFTLGVVADHLIKRNLMDVGYEFESWWEYYTG